MEITEKLIAKTKEWLLKFDYEYDEEDLFYCDEKKEKILRDGVTQKEVYIVRLKLKDFVEYNKNGEIEIYMDGAFWSVFYDAETLEMMYISGHKNYIEPDGTY